MSKEWFVEWFDSQYYHLLYKNHDDDDAQQALDNLLRALDPPPGARMLDLACGKGRHSRYLAEKGFDVTGLDISEASISFARQHEHGHLAFYQHDMRLPFRVNYFDAVMNMFTSFGYFKTDRDHLLTMKNIARNLKPGGLLLLDYFNSQWVRRNLVRSETKIIDRIEFRLSRNIRNDRVYKHVEFVAGGRLLKFRERVRLFNLADFQRLFNESGLDLVQTYGSYDLDKFDPHRSKRLILIARKRAST
ncbi:MAG: class I SAM-dependent methyltransferase [Lewinellaceae bacterium]|nr:class I SAM-dependent methyltransferase [Lewinellaceae bacterium]